MIDVLDERDRDQVKESGSYFQGDLGFIGNRVLPAACCSYPVKVLGIVQLRSTVLAVSLSLCGPKKIPVGGMET